MVPNYTGHKPQGPTPIYQDAESRVWSNGWSLVHGRANENSAGQCLGHPNSLEVRTHIKGIVLSDIDGHKGSVTLHGDVTPLVAVGVRDRRAQWSHVVGIFKELMANGGPIPFFTADDQDDLDEAISVVTRYFSEINEDGEYRSKVVSSFIDGDHPYKYENQGQGRFDVMWGMKRLGVLDKDVVAAGERHLRYVQARCMVLRDVQNFEFPGSGVQIRHGAASFNFVHAIDDAISMLSDLGLCCAVTGTQAAWWALRAANNGPSINSFRHIHFVRDTGLSEDMVHRMQAFFLPGSVLSIEACRHVFSVVNEDKARALLLAEHLAYWHDKQVTSTSLSVEDVNRFIGKPELFSSDPTRKPVGRKS